MKRSRGMAPRSNAVHVIRSMQCCTQSPHQSDRKKPRPPVERSSGARPHVRFQQDAAPTHSRVAPRRRAPPTASDRVTRRPRTGWLRVWRYSVPSSPLLGKVGVGHDLNFGYVVLAHRSVRAEASPLGLEAEAGPRRRGPGPGPVAATATRNSVRTVPPAGQLCAIADFRAEVKADGRIAADGRGMVFAGGNTVGTAVVVTSTGGTATLNVFATLICENVAPFVERDTKPVPLEANGDFRIHDVLTPWPPASCNTPVLLIRNAGNRNWFAAGILKFDGED